MMMLQLLKKTALTVTAIAMSTAIFTATAQEKKRTLGDYYNEGVRLYNAQEYEKALPFFQFVNKKNPRDPRNINYLRQTELAIKSGFKKKQSLEAQLKKVIIPEVNFQNASLGDVIAYLGTRVEELTDGKTAANIIYKGSQEQKQDLMVTMKLRNTPVTEVIRYIGGLTDTSFKYEEHAIVGTPASKVRAAAPAPAPPAQPVQAAPKDPFE